MRACRRRRACARKAMTAGHADRRRGRTALPQAAAVEDLHQGCGRQAADPARRGLLYRRIDRLLLGESVEQHRPCRATAGPRRRRQLAFDQAILATGSRPRELPLAGRPSSPACCRCARSPTPAPSATLRAEVEESSSSAAASSGWRSPRRCAAGGRRVTVVEAQERLLAAPSRRRSRRMSRERLAASACACSRAPPIERAGGRGRPCRAPS